MSAVEQQHRVWLVRHGETEWSRSGRHTGRTDVPLATSGVADARAVGAALTGLDFALVLTSPLARARGTCHRAGLTNGAQVDDDLVEWDYGEYEGHTTAEIRTGRPGWSLWRDGAPAGEDAAGVGRRVDRVIARVRAVDGDVALFAHGHVLRALGARWVGYPATGGARLALSTGSISVLGYEREEPVLWRWNEVCHLALAPPAPGS